MIRYTLLALMLAAPIPAAAEPSECAQRNSDQPRQMILICSNPHLAAVDAGLFRYLQELLPRLPQSFQQEGSTRVQEWLAHRSQCGNVNCLHLFYKKTIPEWFDFFNRALRTST
jgi:uncharacterized protein